MLEIEDNSTPVPLSDEQQIGAALVAAQGVIDEMPELRPAQVSAAVEALRPDIGSDAARLATWHLLEVQ